MTTVRVFVKKKHSTAVWVAMAATYVVVLVERNSGVVVHGAIVVRTKIWVIKKGRWMVGMATGETMVMMKI